MPKLDCLRASTESEELKLFSAKTACFEPIHDFLGTISTFFPLTMNVIAGGSPRTSMTGLGIELW
jgi:hypothetical protein